MGKKSGAELKDEADALSATIAMARKKPLNFALLIGKDGVVLEAHPTKSTDVMRRQAKAAGGGPKGAQGVMNVTGKMIELTCEGDDAPRNLGKVAKRHFAELGVPFKVILLVGGERIDDEGGAGEDAAMDPADEASNPDVPPSGTLDAPVPDLPPADAPESAASDAPDVQPADDAGAMIARLKTVVPAVRVLLTSKSPLADKLMKAAQAAGDAIKAGNFDLAGKLIALLEKNTSGPAPDAPARPTTPPPGAIPPRPATPPPPGPPPSRPAPTPSGVAQDDPARQELMRLGYSTADQEKLLIAAKTDPDAIKTAKEKLVDDVKASPAQTAALKTLAGTDPKAFESALATLKGIDANGPVDLDPAKRQEALESLETARKAAQAAVKDQANAALALDAAKKISTDAGGKMATAAQDAQTAAKALADFRTGLGDPKAMTPQERAAAGNEAARLINVNEEAKKALIDAKKEAEAAAAKEKTATDAKGEADTALTKADETAATAGAKTEAMDAKTGVLDALTFGRLSPNAKPPFKDADKASFIAAFGKDSRLANSGMDIAARSSDPSAVAQNVGLVADKMKDGFASADGKKLDASPDDLRAMSTNALRMGGLQGADYFKGFDDYLKTGKQLAPDPYGGLDAPLANAKDEGLRQNRIALGRTGAVGAAAVGADGKVDFGSDAAKGAMDHMMFHPGSLKTFTPQMNQKMAETKGLFTDPVTGAKAQGVIDKTKVPATGAPGRISAQKIIGGTMGKDAGAVTDTDAKGAVLSAMMTPLSQGPVGSCFSTAPVRAVRETDPLRAMDEYSKIATTGQFKDKGGAVYPANVNPPKGENPLMRSWEYSVATAAAEKANSRERTTLKSATLGSKALGGLKAIVPADAWNTKTDPVTGLQTPGVAAKLRKAVAQQLKFEYNAGPPVGTPPGSGGDGSSTDGGYEIKYGGKALKSDADFLAAMKTIALGASGFAETTPEGQQIVTLVASPAFKTAILDGYGPVPTKPGETRAAPWNIAGGGFENQTEDVLEGGKPVINGLVGANSGTPPKTQTQRSVELLGMFLGQSGPGKKDMQMMSTRGTNANHAFNGLPNDPSLDKIRDPGSAQKIQDELVAPGQRIAATKLSADQAARMFEDQVRAATEGASADERDLLIAALKKRPTTDLTPSELTAKVALEMTAYRDAQAQTQADTYMAEKEPGASTTRKAYILDFYKKRVDSDISAATTTALAATIALPEVVVADSNWGDPASQTLFVLAPDPASGDLMMWKKDKFSGKLTPLGKNWEDADWFNVK